MSLPPIARNLLATVVVLGLLVGAIGAAVYSAYTTVSSNEGNTFTAGSIDLTDNDSGSALFSVSGFVPGDVFQRCIQVNYTSTGNVESSVRLYGTTSGDGLADYVDVEVRRGTTPATNASGDCTGFTPDATDYEGDGAGVIATGELDEFPADYNAAVVDPEAAWETGDSIVYQITFAIQNDNDAQGLSASQDFVFEARTL